MRPQSVPVPALSADRLAVSLTAERAAHLADNLDSLRSALRGRVMWSVSSAPSGGGVAEILHSLLPYLRGAGVDARWQVITGSADFFVLTKKLHNMLHGLPGVDKGLTSGECSLYKQNLDLMARYLSETIRPGDVVFLHDPQTAGLSDPLSKLGALVVWRSHVGSDQDSPSITSAWKFLLPFLASADHLVFSRPSYLPALLRDRPYSIIAPSIDPASAKNQMIEPPALRSILDITGLMRADQEHLPAFTRQDGSPGRVEHGAEVIRTGRPPRLGGDDLVLQVSRWDRLKDPIGVIRGFSEFVAPYHPAHLMVAGPTVHSVADDLRAAEVFDQAIAVWRELPHAHRRRIQLACLPMRDREENAAIVNALQQSASVVTQKSLQEGFGLTLSEAMWKSRPVVASRVGGLSDQVEHGVSGLLVDDPTDLKSFAAAVLRLLEDPPAAARMGAAARRRVGEFFLHDRQISDHARLIGRLLG